MSVHKQSLAGVLFLLGAYAQETPKQNGVPSDFSPAACSPWVILRKLRKSYRLYYRAHVNLPILLTQKVETGNFSKKKKKSE